MPRRPARTPSCRSYPTTTSRRSAACTRIFAPSPKRAAFRSSSTTCPPAPCAGSPTNHCSAGGAAACIGVKDATGDVTRLLRLRSLVGPQFRLLSGDDATAPAFLAQGGDGCISVTSNVAPGLCRDLYRAWKQGQTAYAQRLATVVAKLTTALFRESNPAPVKFALASMGLMLPRVRLPLVEVKSDSKAEIDRIWRTCASDIRAT